MQTIQRTIFIVLVAAMVAALSSRAFSQEATLTQDKVTRFLASFSEMRIIAVSEGLKTGQDAKAASNPFQSLLKAIKSSKLQNEARTIAQRHGFQSIKDWSETGRAIGRAYIHVTVGPKNGVSQNKIDQHKQTASREIDRLGFLTQKQKDKLKENLNDASEELGSTPPPENVAVIKELRSKIEATVKIPGQ